MNPRFSVLACSLTVVLALSGRADAAGLTKTQCISANANGQSFRKDQKLAEAREQFQMCSNPHCPRIVASDCTKRLDELEAAQPTIIFDAKDGAGRDLSAVKVTVDDKLLAEKLDGTPLQVDAGSHVFTFEVAGEAPVTQTFVIGEGVKDRHEPIVVGPPPAPAPVTPPPSPAPPPPPEQHGWTTTRTVGAVAAGVGVAGIAAGTVFGLIAISTWNKALNECGTPSTCNANERSLALNNHDTSETEAMISTVGFAAGGALLVGGVVMFLAGRRSSKESPETPQTGLMLAPAIGPGLSGFSLTGSF